MEMGACWFWVIFLFEAGVYSRADWASFNAIPAEDKIVQSSAPQISRLTYIT